MIFENFEKSLVDDLFKGELTKQQFQNQIIDLDFIKGRGFERISGRRLALIGETRIWGGRTYKKVSLGRWEEVGNNKRHLRVEDTITDEGRHLARGTKSWHSWGGNAEVGPSTTYEHSIQSFHGDKKDGRHVTFHPNGEIKTILDYKDDKKHGDYIVFNPKGLIEGKATFVDGKIHGKVLKNRIVNNKIMDTVTYEQYDGLKQGKEIEKDYKGNLISSKTWKDGKLNGESKKYSGYEVITSNYKDDVLNGVFKEEKYTDDSKKQIFEVTTSNFKDGKLNGFFTRKNSNGDILEKVWYEDGKMNGKGIKKLPSGYTVETRYKDGMKHGVEKTYDENGKLKEELLYSKDRPMKNVHWEIYS